MNNAKRVAAVAAVTIALSGGVLITTAVADSACGPGAIGKTSEQKVLNPATGRYETGTVTDCPDVTTSKPTGTVTSAISPLYSAVDFRDSNGVKTGSGLSNRDQFQYLNEKKTVGGVELIRVKQITKGMGGYGSLYEGWIPVNYTMLPSMFH
ncbi:hypothetical protein [Streptomyces sp. 5-10]|uniref:hypothetical protein n=1 Tax=Streptomyces sp. 5-10 TaxID=878925 RepID=UPI00168B70B3|nr:hypothetical protein [Streptomyces sp. 5-10]MBD3004553.1 hypothetical protein [Streptomyces sp. 5-10]